MIHAEESIFEQAIQLENAHECATFLDQACANQPALRQKIESLLKAYSKGTFLELPVFAVSETIDMPRIQERPGSQIGRYKLLEQIVKEEWGSSTWRNRPNRSGDEWH